MGTTRGERLKRNTLSSLVFQITTIVCGFILPRLILVSYGSQVNGLVNSITQFLHMIAFLELGVGAVVQSSLYGPLAYKDEEQVSKVLRSTEKYFRNIAIILIIYIAVLAAVYPIFVNKFFGYIYTTTLIAAIGISSISQYYFGVVERLLLTADQKGYIQYTVQTVTLVLNTAVCAAFINAGASIQLVKLTTSVIFLLRPLILRRYVNNNYRINRKIKYTDEPIRQKWNGIAQHVAAVVLDETDIIVLTMFSTLTNVSIYSVYHLVLYGVKNVFLSLTNGFQALMGEMLAKKEIDELKRLFNWTEWLLHTGTVFIFGLVGILVTPFVLVYTKGIMDADYVRPIFAALITIAHAGHCLRLPYNMLILAAGHYKQTQWNYIIAAGMNIIISVLTVNNWGLTGVALGTICAMFYQTVWMAFYDSKHILNISVLSFLKHILVDVITITAGVFLTCNIPLRNISYASWIILACIDALIWFLTVFAVNFLFYRMELIHTVGKMHEVVRIGKTKED